MLLHRQPGVRTVPKPTWRTRFSKFDDGEWQQLIRDMLANTAAAPPPPAAEPTQTSRTTRARNLVHLGDLSAARQALLSGPLAPGSDTTLAELRDPDRRPIEPYPATNPDKSNFQPDEPVQLPRALLVANLQRARKGAAPGPSGLTAEALRLILDDEAATDRYIQVAQQVAQGRVPPQASQLLGLGRMVALQKPNGGIRGLVIGDLLRRLVSRSLAQFFATQLQTACRPWQFALSNRSGTEAVVRALTLSTELNSNHTIVSVDGIGAS